MSWFHQGVLLARCLAQPTSAYFAHRSSWRSRCSAGISFQAELTASVNTVPEAAAAAAAHNSGARSQEGGSVRMASVLTKRMSWLEVTALVQRGKTTDVDALGMLGRVEEDLMAYRSHRAKILEKYVSVTDELRSRLFGAPLVFAQDGKLAVAACDPTTTKPYVMVMVIFIKLARYAHFIFCFRAFCFTLCLPCLTTPQIMVNEFPYYIDSDISHLNIWCSNGALSDEAIERLIAERLPTETGECVWFVNPPKYQSIRAVRSASRSLVVDCSGGSMPRKGPQNVAGEEGSETFLCTMMEPPFREYNAGARRYGTVMFLRVILRLRRAWTYQVRGDCGPPRCCLIFSTTHGSWCTCHYEGHH